MPRRSIPIRAVLLAGAALAAGTTGAIAASTPDRPGTTRLAGSAAPVTYGSTRSVSAPAAQQLTIQVWMAVHEQAAQRFVTAVSTPGSPQYRRFLSPAGYTRRFGSGARQVTAVEAFLTRHDFRDVSADVDGDDVSATASVATIDRTFSVRMRRYEAGGATNRNGTIEANDRELSVPAAIRPDILAVVGLDSAKATAATADASPRAPRSECSRYWAQRTTGFSPAFDGVTQAPNAICGYSAAQIRGAYGLSGADTGAGTTVALIQVGVPGSLRRSLADYAARNHLPALRQGQFQLERITQGPHTDCLLAPEESEIDSEAAYAVAPRARQLVVDGDDCENSTYFDEALFAAELAPLIGRDGPRADIESVSYDLSLSGGERTAPRSDLLANHAILLRAAAEGVSVLNSSGDHPGLSPDDADPDVTAVGGTTLGIGADDQRVLETGWSSDFGERVGTTGSWYDAGIEEGASGGTSTLYPEPAYQEGVVSPTLSRASDGHEERVVPDISADADPYTGMRFGVEATAKDGRTSFATFTQAGTSLATPLVAGMVAVAEQGRRGRLGFLNPLLYSLHGTPAFTDVLPVTDAPPIDRAIFATGDTDIDHRFRIGYLVVVNDAEGRGTSQTTTAGYDTMTGLGSPNAGAFTAALRARLRPRRG